MKLTCLLVCLGFVLGCSQPDSAQAGGTKPLVVFSQANSQDPWRQVFDAEMASAAEEHKDDVSYEMQEAGDNPDKQISQVDAFLLKKPAAILISPATVALRAICEKAFDQGIPVILLDRAIPGEKFTTFIAGDNVQIGRASAEYVVTKLGGKGTVLEIYGLAGSTATDERHQGAQEVWSKNPGIKVIRGDHCDYQRNKAQSFMQTVLQRADKFDAILAHNDEMAIGARQALDAAGSSFNPIIVGIDCCQKEVVDLIKAGKLTASFTYPHPARKGMEIAVQMIKGEKNVEKKIMLPSEKVDAENADTFLNEHPNLK
jgi:ribose transport system substrate-binding protein